MKFTFNGQEFTGENFEIKNKVLYVDGHAVMDLKPNTEEISIEGSGNLITDKDVVIYGNFSGNITAKKVIVNGESVGDMVAEKVIINGEHKGNINAEKISDNR